MTQWRRESLVCHVGVKSDVPLLLPRHFHPFWPRKNMGVEMPWAAFWASVVSLTFFLVWRLKLAGDAAFTLHKEGFISAFCLHFLGGNCCEF